MPEPDSTSEHGIIIDATRLKPAFVLAFWRQNGANCRCFLTSGAKTEPISCETSSHHPTATFEPPKRHWFWDFLKILFERRLCWQRETVLSSPFYLRTATWRAKKRHGFSKNLSTKLPKPAPLKKRHLFFAFLLRWSAVADSGVIFSALSSTPVPHGFEAKSKHRAENFLLLLYRNIQSQKVNTASKSFLKSPLFLYRNIERKIFNINFKNAANAPHSLTATSEAKKRHRFLKVLRKVTN